MFDDAIAPLPHGDRRRHARELSPPSSPSATQRHRRMGDSRYVVEPNVKDGKGGLRDLHTLYWIGQYVFGVERPADLVDKGLFTAAEFRRFERAERFFWSVRCHLHLAAGRAEERLGFDMQRQIAEAMRYADRPGQIGGRALHAILFPQRQDGRRSDRPVPRPARRADGRARAAASRCRRFAAGRKRLNGFTLDRGRLSIPSDDWFCRRSGAAGRAVRAGRARGAGNPPQRDARRGPRRAAGRPGSRRPARQRLVPGRADQPRASPTWCCAG